MKKLTDRITDAVIACQQHAKKHGIHPRHAEQCDGQTITYFSHDSKHVEIKACDRCIFEGDE